MRYQSLGFKECNYAACFQEYELVFKRDTAAETAAAIRELYDQQVCSWTVLNSNL